MWGEVVNGNLIRAKMAELGMTQADTAREIGISLSRFNAKLNGTGDAEFSLPDVIALKNVLRLSPQQVDEIFLQ